MVNLGLFGSATAHLRLGNALARTGSDGTHNRGLERGVELILTNPPFGATYSGEDISNFAMGNKRPKANLRFYFWNVMSIGLLRVVLS